MYFFSKLKRKVKGFFEITNTYKNWPIWLLYKVGVINKKIKLYLRKGVSFNVSERNNLETIDEVWRNKVQIREMELPKNGIIIDIGANIGAFSIMAANELESGVVLSYEPEDKNYSALQRNVSDNDLENKIKPIRLAVSNEAGESFLFLGKASGYHTLSPSESANKFTDDKKQVIKTTSLENIFEENNIINCAFLKMDCEGAEKVIILNTDIKYLRRISCMVIECHNGYQEIINHLTENGFEIKLIPHTNKTGVVYAKLRNL